MRLSRRALIVVALLLLRTVPLYNAPGPGSIYVPPPPPPPDLPDFPDPPDLPPFPEDPLDIPFDPMDLPDPWEIPPPPEDPWDDPIGDFPEPPPFPDVDDPFPDLPSFINTDDIGYAPSFGGALMALPAEANQPAPNAAAANVVTKLMPFPARIPFYPMATVRHPPKSARVCDPLHASKLIVGESKKNTIAFLDTCPWQITAHVQTGPTPAAVAATPDGQFALVANAGDGNTSGTISAVSLTSKTVTKTINLSAPDNSVVQPNGIGILPDGSRAYVTDHECNPNNSSPESFVFVIDLTTYTVVNTIPGFCFPASIAVTPDGSQVWITSRGDSRVDVYDTATNTPVTAFNISLPTGIAIDPTGSRAYIASTGASPGAITVIDMNTYTQIGTPIPVGTLPHVVAITPSGRYIYVTNALSNSISEISPITLKVIRTINLPNGLKHPLGITFIQ